MRKRCEVIFSHSLFHIYRTIQHNDRHFTICTTGKSYSVLISTRLVVESKQNSFNHNWLPGEKLLRKVMSEETLHFGYSILKYNIDRICMPSEYSAFTSVVMLRRIFDLSSAIGRWNAGLRRVWGRWGGRFFVSLGFLVKKNWVWYWH